MDQTFLQLMSLLVQLTNQVAALQQENQTLKTAQHPPDWSEATEKTV